MCGLIGFVGRTGGEEAQDFIMDQFQEQKHRGERGFGLIRADAKAYRVRRAVDSTKALIDVSRANEPILLFHHRIPTSTDNSMDQTHPMLVEHSELAYNYVVIHNGVIRNDNELMKRHTEELGYVYRTLETKQYSTRGYTYNNFNDSEAFAVELARYLDEKADQVGTEGHAAFIAMRVDKKSGKPVTLFWGTNGGNPLIWDQTPAGLVIASELDTGFAMDAKTYAELKVADIFNSKKAKKELQEFVQVYHMKFLEPKPATYPMGFGTPKPIDIEKPTSENKTEEGKKSEEDDPTNFDFKETPVGYTDREWAFRKMGLRQLENFNTVILDYYDQLALFDETYQGHSVPYTIEDLLDDTENQIHELLESSAERAKNVNEWFNAEEKKREGKAKNAVDTEQDDNDRKRELEIELSAYESDYDDTPARWRF